MNLGGGNESSIGTGSPHKNEMFGVYICTEKSKLEVLF